MYTFILFISIAFILLVAANWKCKTTQCRLILDRNYTNVLRGLAMVMIMFGHVGGAYEESVWFSPLPAVGVALFLMLSGYGNNESYLNKRVFGGGNLLKIALPYWIVAVPLFCINGVNNWTNCILNLSFVRINSVYWFVGYIMQWYLVYWFAINYAYRYRWLLFAAFSILTMVLLPSLQVEQALSFPCGVWISEHKEWVASRSRNWLVTIASLLFVVGTFALGFKQTGLVRSYMEYAPYVDFFIKLPWALVVVIVLRPLRFLSNHKLLVFIGGITYELYLVHMQCLRLIETTSPIHTALTTIAFLAISFVGAWGLKKLNEWVMKQAKL